MKTCDKCGEPLEKCEACGAEGCPTCEVGWGMDSEGVWLCRKCDQEVTEEWLHSTDNGAKVCENCKHFANEDDEGYGDCSVEKDGRFRQNYCDEWVKKIE